MEVENVEDAPNGDDNQSALQSTEKKTQSDEDKKSVQEQKFDD